MAVVIFLIYIYVSIYVLLKLLCCKGGINHDFNIHPPIANRIDNAEHEKLVGASIWQNRRICPDDAQMAKEP